MTSAADLAHARADLFPTRLPPQQSPPRLIERSGPIVRGDAARLEDATGLTDAAARFDADGYLALPGFFDAERAAQWRDEAARLAQWCARERPVEAFFEKHGGGLRSLFDATHFSEVFGALARDPRLVRMATALVGDAPYLHQARLNYKPALTGGGFFWHSDFETWHAEDGMPDMRAVSVSISLCDNTVFNGPLLLLPGSHRTFVPCEGATPEDHYRKSLVSQEIGTPPHVRLEELIARRGIDMATGPAGSVVVFDCNMLHASAQNLSADPRVNLFLVYNACSNALLEPYAAPRPRPEFVAARKRRTPLRDSGGS